jgi:hypothetical protein
MDLCVFGIGKVLHKRENTTKGLEGETLKIYRDLEAFCRSAIIPMARWSLSRAWFQLNPDNFLPK